MAYRRVVLTSAQLEFEAIVAYLAEELANPSAAKHFINEFEQSLDAICELPEMHALSRMPELAALGYRPLLFANYVALYRFDGQQVVIAHIFHQTQDYARLI
jgi:plasmid stabilization system protein ParE